VRLTGDDRRRRQLNEGQIAPLTFGLHIPADKTKASEQYSEASVSGSATGFLGVQRDLIQSCGTTSVKPIGSKRQSPRCGGRPF
jgi:hypothetical protein